MNDYFFVEYVKTCSVSLMVFILNFYFLRIFLYFSNICISFIFWTSGHVQKYFLCSSVKNHFPHVFYDGHDHHVLKTCINEYIHIYEGVLEMQGKGEVERRGSHKRVKSCLYMYQVSTMNVIIINLQYVPLKYFLNTFIHLQCL